MFTIEEEKALYDYLREKRADFYDFGVDSTYGDLSIVEVEVSWGDWKHSHLRLDYLMEEFMKSINRKILKSNTNVTEEDGSDCYSARHYYIIK